MKNIIKYAINQHITKMIYNALNVKKNTINNQYNILKIIVKNVLIMNE